MQTIRPSLTILLCGKLPTDMVSAAGNGGGYFDGRLNGTVPFLVKGVQLDNDNYNTIFNGMIQW